MLSEGLKGIICAFVGLIAGFMICLLLASDNPDMFGDALKDRCFLIDNDIISDEYHAGTNGIYDPNSGVYCVHTRGRTLSEIERTDYHESCHSFVKEDYYHFCVENKLDKFYSFCEDEFPWIKECD